MEMNFSPEYIFGQDSKIALGFKVQETVSQKVDGSEEPFITSVQQLPKYYNAFYLLNSNLNYQNVHASTDKESTSTEIIGVLPVDSQALTALGYRDMQPEDAEFVKMQGIPTAVFSNPTLGTLLAIKDWHQTPILLHAYPEKDGVRECFFFKMGKIYKAMLSNFNQLSIVTESLKYFV